MNTRFGHILSFLLCIIYVNPTTGDEKCCWEEGHLNYFAEAAATVMPLIMGGYKNSYPEHKSSIFFRLQDISHFEFRFDASSNDNDVMINRKKYRQ